jgi:hypothetical protein
METKIRAQQIFTLVTELLINGEEDDSIFEAYKYSFLILNRPGAFLARFGRSDAYINVTLVQDGFFKLRRRISGEVGLSEIEFAVLDQHNNEVCRLH